MTDGAPAPIDEGPWEAIASEGCDRFLARLDAHLAIVLRGFISRADREAMLSAIEAAKGAWTPDFGGEQFSLGRAFYTHLETDRSRAYFAGAAASNALVEKTLPGMQRRVLDLLRALVGGEVRARRGWCGPGVHVFPAGEKVARVGGVVHFDTEGLTDHQLEHGARALTLVIPLMLPERGGGLRLWDALYEGHDEARKEEIEATSALVPWEPGDAVIFESYRLHQIQPFAGARDRVTITAHAVELDPGIWDVWF